MILLRHSLQVQSPTACLCSSSLCLSQAIQETLWLWTVQYTQRLVQENTACIGLDMAQKNPIQESFTLMETGVISVRRALRLGLLHRAVSTTSPRETSACLMLGLTTYYDIPLRIKKTMTHWCRSITLLWMSSTRSQRPRDRGAPWRETLCTLGWGAKTQTETQTFPLYRLAFLSLCFMLMCTLWLFCVIIVQNNGLYSVKLLFTLIMLCILDQI
jgi:hypothetical protein